MNGTELLAEICAAAGASVTGFALRYRYTIIDGTQDVNVALHTNVVKPLKAKHLIARFANSTWSFISKLNEIVLRSIDHSWWSAQQDLRIC